MKAMIFSAGMGTRFKPWTDKHPKALAMVNGRSLLQRNVEYLQQYGIKELVVNVHHFADQIIESIGKHNGWGSHIQISDETYELLETGGGLLHAQPLFNPGETFLTCNADFLTDLNIDHLLERHRKEKALVSFAVSNRRSSRNLLFDDHDRLCGWQNTSTGQEIIAIPGENLQPKAYSCVVAFEYDIFRLMREKGFSGKFSIIDVYLALAPEQLIIGHDHSGDKLVDVGKPESVEIAEALFK
ncbi:MAG: NTP transferase domain-containing protein [Chitinophagaceae bacterium]|nr:NTP transferase domain-containing protein [Chitinophagaceae bacterium]